MNIAQIRDKYPQYKDLGDKQLADALHAKFYSDLPVQDYYKRIGFAPESTVLGELVRGGKQLASSIRTGAGSIVSPEEAALAGVERSKQIAAEAGEGPSFAAVKEAYGKEGLLGGAKEVVSQIPRALAGQGAQLATMAGGARLGAMAGAPFGPAGAVVGGIGGTALALLPQFMGSDVERQAQVQLERGEPVNIDRTKAYSAAAGQAVLEGVGTAFTLGKRVVKGILGIADDAALTTAKAQQELVKTAQRSIAASAGRGALRGTAEIPVEVAQSVLERAQAGLDVTSPEALAEYGESAYLAGLVGPTIGGAAGVVERRSARAAQPAPGAAPTLPGEAPIERAERLKAEAEAAKAAAQPPAPPVPTTAPAPGETAPVAEAAAPVEQPVAPPEGQAPADVFSEAALDWAERNREGRTPAAEEQPAAPPIEEPKVRKVGEPPATGLQPAEIEALGISKKQPIYRRMLGKDLEDPTQRDAVLADIENYLTRGNGTEESRTKLTEFKAKFAPPPAAVAAPTPPVAPSVQPETPSVAEPQPEEGGAGVPVAGGPAAVSTAEGARPEPDGVVPTVADVAGAAGREGAEPAAVTPPTPAPAAAPTPAQPPAPAPTPAQVERELATLVESGRITEEQAADYRAELLGEAEEAPTTAIGQAFQKQIGDIKAQMDALRQKSGKPPAPKSKNRAKFDELQAQLDALSPVETGTLKEKLEKAEATGVFEVRDGKPILDIPAVREALKGRDPKMLKAVLTYIGVDEDGDYLPTTYSADEAAQSVGLAKSSGANVRRIAETLGITADVISRFQAAQTGAIGIAKNVSEASLSGISVENPKAGLLYETGKKGVKAVGFLRPALTETGQLDFSKLDIRQLADIYSRASRYDAKDNTAVMQQLNAEVEARRKADRAGTDAAINRAYGKLVEEEETRAEEEAEPIVEEGAEEPEFDDKTQRLSDEDIEYRLTEASEGQPKEKVEKVVAQVTENWNNVPPIEVVQSEIDLPQKIQNQIKRDGVSGRVPGFFNNGRVWLIADNISGAQEVFDTISHEVTGHYGLRGILGPKYKETMGRIYEGNTEIRVKANEKMKVLPKLSREVAVEEVLADMQEKDRSRPLFKRIVGVIRTALQKLFKGKHYFSQDQVEDLLYQSRDWVRNGKPSQKMVTDESLFRLAPATEAAVQGVDVIGEKERQTLTQRIAQDLKGNPALKLRMKFTDSLAPLEDFFVNAYGGATRTAKGRLNPMVLLSRALDALRVSKAVQEQGGLGFDSGLIVAKDLQDAEGRPVSYTGVLNRVAEAAKQRGETYETFRTKIDTVLYGHREYGLREMNKTLPKDEQIELLIKDPAKLDELEAAFQKDDFIKQVSADLDTIRFNLLDTLVETGRISKERAQDYKDATGYIPFNRLGDYEKVYQSTKGANRGAAALRNIRKLEGSERKTTSPIENFSGLVDWATKEAMKNHAALSALKDMALMGAAFKRPTKPAEDSPGDMVTVYDNGKPVQYYVPDPAHLIAFSIQDPVIPDSFKLLQKGSQILRAGVTSMPPFAIKQVFDDIVRAYTYAGVKNNAALVKSVMLNFPKNWVNEVLKKKPKDIKNLEALGIVGTFDFSQQGNLKNILEEAGAKKEGLGSTIMRVMEAGAKASDLAVRQAVYDQVMKETNGDKAQAESAAREIINFSRRGSSQTMNLLISVIPFFNAYARGMDKLATAAAGGVVGQSTGTARSMFYKRMGVMTSMGLLYALLMQDDEEYQQLPDHVRDTNWILPYGKELGFVPAIPIPAELAFFFKAIPERIVRYYKMYGTEEEQTALDVVGNLAKRGRDVFSSPNITPQLLRPLYENITNYSWFLDRPLESQAQQALRPFERYGTGTSDAMKSLAKSMENVANATGVEAFAISPIKLENVVRGIFGTAAGLGLSMADMMINPGRTDRPLNQQLGAQLTGLSAVTKDPIGTRQLDFIYDLEKRVEQVNGTVNRLTERKPEDVDQFIKDNIGLYSIRGPVQGVMSGIRALNQAAMMIDRDTSLSPEERRKRIDELRVEQNKLAQQAQMLRKMARDIQMGK